MFLLGVVRCIVVLYCLVLFIVQDTKYKTPLSGIQYKTLLLLSCTIYSTRHQRLNDLAIGCGAAHLLLCAANLKKICYIALSPKMRKKPDSLHMQSKTKQQARSS
jgi:hypothetical protein